MSEDTLPHSWVWTTLGEICSHPQYGYTTKAAESGDTLFLRTTDITSGKIDWATVPYCAESPEDPDKYQLYDGDIVISRAGSVGFSNRVQSPPKAVFASYLIRFRPFIDQLYFALFLKSPFYWRAISDSKSGIAVGNVNAQKLAAITIPLPPLNEQKRIVAKIEELFSELEAGEESLRLARQQLGVYRQSLLKQAFEGKLTETWRTQNPAQLVMPNVPPVTEDKELGSLPNLPTGWLWTHLSNIGELGRGKSKHRPRNDPKLFGGSYPFIQTGEVKAASKTVKFYTETYSEFGLAQSKLWPKGTLCITIAANIAETAFLGFDGCFPDSVVGFVPVAELVNAEFVELFIRAARDRIEKYAPATAQKNINLTTLENLVIPLCSLPEQQEIVRLLDAQFDEIERNEREIAGALRKSEALRQAILKRAFTGRLVPQDPSDEPASALLARLRAEPGSGLTKSARNKIRQPKNPSSPSASDFLKGVNS